MHLQPSSAALEPPADRAAAVVGLALCTLLASLGTSVVHVALPTLTAAYDRSFGEVQWVALAYLLAITATIVGAGRVGDLLGRRRGLLAGIGLFVAASAAAALAPSFPVLVAARVAQGIGAAFMTALSLSLAQEATPHLGRAMGTLGAASALGTALGPAFGGALLSGLGWTSLFWVNVPLGLLAAVLLRTLPGRPPTVSARFDAPGTVVLAAALTAWALAVSERSPGWAAAAAVAGAALAVVESRSEAPLLRWAFVRDPVLARGVALSALVSAVVMFTLVLGPFLLSRVHGLDVGWTGVGMAVGPAVAAASGVPAGRLVDRLGGRRAGRVGLAVMAVGCAGVTAGAPALVTYLGPIGALTAGYALFQAANHAAVLRGVASDARGVAAALLHLGRHLGLITGSALAGAVFAAASGDLASATGPEIVSGARWAFGAASVVLAIAARASGRGGEA